MNDDTNNAAAMQEAAMHVATMKIDTILLATDLSPLAIAALPIVAGLARDLDAQVQFVYVDAAGSRLQGAASALARRDVEGRLESLRRAAAAWGLQTSARVLAGEPAEALRSAAERDRHALLTLVHEVGHHGRASLTRSLVSKAAAPILIVHAPKLEAGTALDIPMAHGIHRICCAVTPDESGSDSLRCSAAFARVLGAHLKLVAVLTGRGLEPDFSGQGPLLAEPPAGMQTELHAVGLRLRALAADLGQEGVGAVVVAANEAAAGLSAAAIADGASLLIVAPQQRSRLARALLGSVTDRLLHLSPLPLLVLGEAAAAHLTGSAER